MAYNTQGISRKSAEFRGAEGCKAKRVLVYGDAVGEAKNAPGANAGNLFGVTFDSAEDGKAVALSQYGFPEIEISQPIPVNTRVNVAADGGNPNDRGMIKPVNEAVGTVVNLVGITKSAGTRKGQRVMVDCRRFGEQIVV
ncbi:hypothetical protein GBA65_14945 [Rubrobacter marinus]|uniref:Uncharacterized protein n=1 Tax=Rubrobacter marinus TaxID=2653852 RepID=A0A6G8PZE2_9ACTN|nr:hypothetical protein [Rubrobacter marinus]QIN79604.1 hypothetical protein GBA65_14945 [Rubrobacter marinus]